VSPALPSKENPEEALAAALDKMRSNVAPAQSNEQMPSGPSTTVLDSVLRVERRTRRRGTLLVTLGIILTIGAIWFLWNKATPPLVARILPESQGILYFNLGPLRAATQFDRRPVAHASDYQHFINATGINFERDLDQAAFALDHLPDDTGPNGGLAFSEVFAGRFDPIRLGHYLAGISPTTENYDNHIIFNIPSDGRTVRVAILSHGLVAISNTPTAEQIHSMLDRDRSAWLPFSSNQPMLLTEHYRDLPALSLAWGLGQIGLPFGDHGEFHVLGFTLPIRLDATFVASLRWTGALRLRIEEIAPNASAAKASAQALSGLLGLARLTTSTLPEKMTSDDLRTLIDNSTVGAYEDRAVLKTTLPANLLRSIVQSPDSLATRPANP
jgi:hypothetical protein